MEKNYTVFAWLEKKIRSNFYLYIIVTHDLPSFSLLLESEGRGLHLVVQDYKKVNFHVQYSAQWHLKSYLYRTFFVNQFQENMKRLSDLDTKVS